MTRKNEKGRVVYYMVVNKDGQPLISNGDTCGGAKINNGRFWLFKHKKNAIDFLNNRKVEKGWRKRGRKIIEATLSFQNEFVKTEKLQKEIAEMEIKRQEEANDRLREWQNEK